MSRLCRRAGRRGALNADEPGVDRVAAALEIESFETPTGWKYFGNLLDAGRITLCGEESAGTGSNHVREKDGLWAILLWLNILAVTGLRADEIVRDHWRTFGRDYYARHDYEEVEIQAAQAVMEGLRTKLSRLKGQRLGTLTVLWADEFSYVDPLDGSRSDQQGIRVVFAEDARAVFRVSGTGTSGATIRVYLERYESNSERLNEPTSDMLAEVVAAARSVSDIVALTGRSEPSVVT
ncbi:hypothetical protein JNW90_26895 [Micromonospora sp. STR1s_5]|nr:hypothetical protein [Micromonospora sp. STR1s_5]